MVRSISEIRREEITEAVLTLLAEQGPRALSVQAIASQVGLAKASLYQHFSSVDEMVEGAILSVKSKFLELLDKSRQTVSDPKQRLWLFFRDVGNLPTVPEALVNIDRIESKNVGRWREMMLEFRDTLEAEVVKDIHDAQTAGSFRQDMTAEELLEIAFALYHYMKTEKCNPRFGGKLANELEHVWYLFTKAADKRCEFDQAGEV
jgi:TetR/AcrR family transcriptional regulator, regulator of autoinduction and epiphytic fitness